MSEMVPTPTSNRGEGLVPELTFSTAPYSGASALDSWHARTRGTYDTSHVPSDAGRFQVDVSSWHLGDVIGTYARSTSREETRSAQRIRSDQIDHYRVTLQLTGAMRLDANGRRAVIHPGQLSISDMARPIRYSVDKGDYFLLIIPRSRLDAVLPQALDLHGVVPQGAAATLLALQMRGLVDQAKSLFQAEAHSLSHSLLHLVAAAITPRAHELAAEAKISVENALLRQICRYVESNLGDDSISPVALARVFKISRATLYRLFEPLGGVAAYIRERRLAKIHDLLARPERRHYLAKLAEEHGFSDAATLSRAFKKHFGYVVSDVRAQAIPAEPVKSVSTDVAMIDWMRSLDAPRDRYVKGPANL